MWDKTKIKLQGNTAWQILACTIQFHLHRLSRWTGFVQSSNLPGFINVSFNFTVFVSASAVCDAMYAGSCYVIVSESLTWTSARSSCETIGGHLVTIDSQEENDVIHNIAVSKFYKALQI